MRIRLHGSALAVALSGLAVVLAGSGTAVAVKAASSVVITDKTNTTRSAQVDAAGRLATLGGTSTVNGRYFVSLGTGALISPTTATLAVSRVAMSNTGLNAGYSNTDFAVSLVKINVGSSGGCYDADATTVTTYSRFRVAVGANVVDSYAAPMVVKPTGSTAYCLGVAVSSDDPGTPSTYYLPSVQLTAVVAAGNYTGVGSAARPAQAQLAQPLATPTDPRPAGAAGPDAD